MDAQTHQKLSPYASPEYPLNQFTPFRTEGGGVRGYIAYKHVPPKVKNLVARHSEKLMAGQKLPRGAINVEVYGYNDAQTRAVLVTERYTRGNSQTGKVVTVSLVENDAAGQFSTRDIATKPGRCRDIWTQTPPETLAWVEAQEAKRERTTARDSGAGL